MDKICELGFCPISSEGWSNQRPVAYHTSLSLMANLHDFFFGGHSSASKAAVYHLSQAVKLVNQQLRTPKAISNSSLAVVNHLVGQELLQGGQPIAEMHLEGLQKMVELRGGLSQLVDNVLILKICKYVSLRR